MPPHNEDESVSMEVLRDMLEQQKQFYVEMINKQESNFLSFTKMILDTVNTRIDGVMKDVQELKTSLQFSQGQIDDLRGMERKMDSFEVHLQQLSSQCTNSDISDIVTQVDFLENQSRRNNVIIDGLSQENAFESWSDSEKKIREFMSTMLKIDSKSIEIERAHRIGNLKQNAGRPRPIVVKFLRYKDKELILAKAKAHLKRTGIYVNEDFSDRIRKKRAELLPAMKQAREKGNFAVISYDKLIVKPRQHQQMAANNGD